MATFQALFFIIAIVLLLLAAFPVQFKRTKVSFGFLAAACALIAYAAPTIDAAF